MCNQQFKIPCIRGNRSQRHFEAFNLHLPTHTCITFSRTKQLLNLCKTSGSQTFLSVGTADINNGFPSKSMHSWAVWCSFCCYLSSESKFCISFPRTLWHLRSHFSALLIHAHTCVYGCSWCNVYEFVARANKPCLQHVCS